jgi:hypothetical protein
MKPWPVWFQVTVASIRIAVRLLSLVEVGVHPVVEMIVAGDVDVAVLAVQNVGDRHHMGDRIDVIEPEIASSSTSGSSRLDVSMNTSS